MSRGTRLAGADTNVAYMYQLGYKGIRSDWRIILVSVALCFTRVPERARPRAETRLFFFEIERRFDGATSTAAAPARASASNKSV